MSLDDRIDERLRSVIDPETRENVVEMGLVRELVATREGKVSCKFRPTSFHCPLALKLAFDIREALEGLTDITEVDLEVVDCIYADEINRFLKTGEI